MPNPFDPTSLPVVRKPSPVTFVPPETGKKRPEPLRSSLVASAKRMTGEAKIGRVGASGTNWQADAWDMFDLVGEQHFLVTTLASRLSQARLYVGRKTEDADSRPDEDSVPDDVREVFESFGGSDSARSQMLRRMAINLQVPGDLWIVGIPAHYLNKDDSEGDEEAPEPRTVDRSTASEEGAESGVDLSGELEWRVLSIDEVSSSNPGEIKIKLGEDDESNLELSLDEVSLVRVWQPHPRKAWEADSPTKASLPVLRELVGLTMHISAQVDSRLAGAGILVVPQSAQRALATAAGYDEVGAENEDLFLDGLMTAMTTAIQDRSSASALVPLVVTVPDEVTDSFNHITFANPLDAEARELRDEAIRRLALGQDAPPEVLLGTDGMNHWGAWLVNEEVVTTHLEPPLALISDALTIQFLWPTLEALGVADFEEYVVWYDVDHLIARPTRAQDALALHERGILSDEAVRAANGFEESDAPSVEQLHPAVVSAIELAKGAPTLIQSPGLPTLVEQLKAVYQMGEEGANDLTGNGEVDPGEPEGKLPTPAETTAPGTGGGSSPAGGAPTAVGPAKVGNDSPLAASALPTLTPVRGRAHARARITDGGQHG